MDSFDLDTLARDVAFEIELGGDRFGPDDLAVVLDGIGREDLDKFRSRIMLHAEDFSPKRFFSTDFTSRQVSLWLEGIKTSEQYGRGGTDWFKDVELTDDRGRYFAFKDGSVHRCDYVSARAMWGAERAKDIIGVLSEKEYIEHEFDLLFQNGQDSGQTDFITFSSLPEGRIVLAVKNGDERSFLLDDGSSLSLESIVSVSPAIILNILEFELDERLYRAISEKEIHRQDVSDFKLKANELIDGAGERVCRDFLYDQVLVKEGKTGRVYVCRDVDDLRDPDRLSISVLVVDESGRNHVRVINEDTDAGFLVQMLSALDERLEMMHQQNGLMIEDGRIDFLDGPVIQVCDEAPDGRCFLSMKVQSLQSDGAGGVVAVGRFVGPDGLLGDEMSHSLFSLSDKSLKKIREATDGVFHSLRKGETKGTVKNLVSGRSRKKGGKIGL